MLDPSGCTSKSRTLKTVIPEGLIGIGDSHMAHNGCVPYTHYPFIKPDNFAHVSIDDIDFLTAQGAFQLPVMQVLEEFLQEYFRHVHPHLPLIDEGVFWDAFYGNTFGRGEKYQISLFTFQAMLFACSNVKFYLRSCRVSCSNLFYSLFP